MMENIVGGAVNLGKSGLRDVTEGIRQFAQGGYTPALAGAGGISISPGGMGSPGTGGLNGGYALYNAGNGGDSGVETGGQGDIINERQSTPNRDGGMQGAGDYETGNIIGRSLRAKAKNYDIFTPDGEILNFSEGTHIRNVEIIAGQGRNRQIDMVDSLVDKYGGDRAKWKKCKGLGYVDVDGESYLVELHWYEEPSTGRVEFKIKRQPGGAWFINED